MARSNKRMETPRLALVGAETLLGRELQEVLKSRIPEAFITPYSATGEGNFGEEDGEAIYREPLEAKSLGDIKAVLIAGTEAGARRTLQLMQEFRGTDSKPVLIDCTGYLDGEPGARLVAPLLDHPDGLSEGLLVIAHAAASALSVVLTRLSRGQKLRRAVAHVFEPASERGKRGITELHQQTTGLLSFKTLPKEVFDNQLSFNLLAQYGAEAPQQLSSVEQRIEKDLAALIKTEQRAIPMPSLRLIQAPVFHGYSISLWAEFAGPVNATELGEMLASAQIEIRGPEEEAPHSVGAASQSGLIAGDIRVDRSDACSAWFWIVGDNLRLTADAAVDVIAGLGIE